jgi:hypothetical protein
LPDEPLPAETLPFETLELPGDEAVGVGVAVAKLDAEDVEPDEVLGVVEVLPELPDVELTEVPARWACAACPANSPRLAAPAVTTTATANRTRLRMFMAQP